MRLEQSFELQVSVERSWSALLDIELVASCLPGVTLTSFDAESFSGRVTMAMGPVALTIAGSGRFVERDQAGKRIVLVASGQDSSGAGAVAVRVTAVAHSARGGEATTVKIIADVDLTGLAAQLGRSLPTDTSSGVVKRFAERLAAAIDRAPVPDPSPVPAPDPTVVPAPDPTVVPAPDLIVVPASDPSTVPAPDSTVVPAADPTIGAASGSGAAAASGPGAAAVAAHTAEPASVSTAGSGPAGMSVPAGVSIPAGVPAPAVSVLAVAASSPDGTMVAGQVTERIAMQPVALVDEIAVQSVTTAPVALVTSAVVVSVTSIPAVPVTSIPEVLVTSVSEVLVTSAPAVLVTSGAVADAAGSVTQASEAASVEGVAVVSEPVVAPPAMFVTEPVPLRLVAEIDAPAALKPAVPQYHWLAMAPLDPDAQAQPTAVPSAGGPQMEPALLGPQALLAPQAEPLSAGSDSPEASQMRRTGLYLIFALIILVGFMVWWAAR